MLAVAQTNLQLYNQSLALGYNEEELGQLRTTYDLVRELFSGLYRPSGKTFVAHLVGTASILMSCKVDIDVINAGLIHAAYMGGDFGENKPGITERKRKELVRTIGSNAEQIVSAYTQQPWPPVDIQAFSQQAASSDARQHAATLIRIANELEEHIDQGVNYCHEKARKRILLNADMQESLISVATRLGYTLLADALAEAFTTTGNNPVSNAACSRDHTSKSILIPPRSYRKVMQLLVSRVNDRDSDQTGIVK